ncbi:MAG: peptidyl-prolyl cis-trans isomerase [Sedimentisphaerales bacterium]|nr:peptidyl-prolyl cis-trans isomerase [Sedimentisphaerales bacterium]
MSKPVHFAWLPVVSLSLVLIFGTVACRTASGPQSAEASSGVSEGVVSPAVEAAAPPTSESAAMPAQQVAATSEQPSVAPVSEAPAAQPSQQPADAPESAPTPVAQPAQQPADVSENAPAQSVASSQPSAATEKAAAQVSSDPNGGPSAPEAKADPSVVATIGDFVITKDELVTRCLQAFRSPSEGYTRPPDPVTAEGVLLTIIGEKAMMMEARKLGYLNDPTLSSYVEQQRRRKLDTMVVNNYVNEHVTVTDAEIDEAMKANPKLSREQARIAAIRPKANAALQVYYRQLVAKFHLKTVQENFAKASEVHERLLNSPVKPRNVRWIQPYQIRDEVSAEEQALALATYDGGQVTIVDWLEALCEMIPPNRPKNLNTPEGVGQFLESAVGPRILVAEAKALGYDKDPTYMREMRKLEDQYLLWKFQSEQTTSIPEPNDEEIKAFFDSHKEWFAEGPSIKVDQVWCKDLATAEEVKRKLDAGEDIQAVRKAYSLDKTETPFYALSPGGEGLFWDDIWKGEPNQVIGPVKGLYMDGVRWRVVKVLEKTPIKLRPYSEQTQTPAKWAFSAERRKAVLDACEKELREKYGYKVYAERVRDVDPFAVVEGEVRR